ncbi:MAG: hypothetical protein HUJ26_12620 [Planctomycetaceae bacterium]|nr:hypothetical protein [Planctomycetaceae bacterium]
MASQKIGELNGTYAKLFKLALWAMPPTIASLLVISGGVFWWMWRIEDKTTDLAIALAVEKEVNAQFRQSAEQFTQSDGNELKLSIQTNKDAIGDMKQDLSELLHLVRNWKEDGP